MLTPLILRQWIGNTNDVSLERIHELSLSAQRKRKQKVRKQKVPESILFSTMTCAFENNSTPVPFTSLDRAKAL